MTKKICISRKVAALLLLLVILIASNAFRIDYHNCNLHTPLREKDSYVTLSLLRQCRQRQCRRSRFLSIEDSTKSMKDLPIRTSLQSSNKSDEYTSIANADKKVAETSQSSSISEPVPTASLSRHDASDSYNASPAQNNLKSNYRYNDDPIRHDSLASLFLIAMSSFGLIQIWESLLLNFEWMQTWRYMWPLIGGVYFVEGISSIVYGKTKMTISIPETKVSSLEENNTSSTPAVTNKLAYELPLVLRNVVSVQEYSPWMRIATGFAGLGLVVGGAADAWLPVYVTGPNLITTAGLGPDSAAFLGFWQVMRLLDQAINIRSSPEEEQKQQFEESTSFPSSLWASCNAIILSQLYILAAGSIDDISSQISENLAF